MMTTGAYGGVGAIIQKLPSGGILISQIYENTPAVKYNLEPGDTIIAIDTVSTFDKSVSECSALMRGRPGSKVPMKIIKGRSGETVVVDLVRERIHVNDVVYSGFVNDTTGYILIGGFTLKGSEDVKKAFLDMKEQGNLKQLILDLRGNGGGLMSEAVDILSLFVPKGTLVVSAKGKHPDANFEYRTQNNPIDTEIPLMVMVDGGSASSSEIVAGAIQDLDRGVIAGQRTFGKGLVQSIRPTGYNTSLKLTTAKYYTPSGRCIQKPYEMGKQKEYRMDVINRFNKGELTNADSIHFPDSLKFQTLREGRTVYGGGGIMPDYFVPLDTTKNTKLYRQIVAKRILVEENMRFMSKNRKSLKAKYPTFDDYRKNFVVPENIIANIIAEGKKSMKEEVSEEDTEKTKGLVKQMLRALIARDIWDTNEYFAIIYEDDDIVKKALQLLEE
jgi:carboxyl-terminal processing protease